MRGRRPVPFIRGILAGGVMAGLGYLVGSVGLPESELDIFGDLHKIRTQDEINAAVERAVSQRMQSADAAGKYALQFLADDRSEKAVHVGTLEGGNGLLGKLDTLVRGDNLATLSHKIGEICMEETAYDTVRSNRYDDSSRPADLIESGEAVVIQPANKELPPLQFVHDDAGLPLTPSDDISRFILAANGCSTGQ